MKLLGNIIWLIFGGLECAATYFVGSLTLALTIIGLPWALQTLKLGMLCLWPFGTKVVSRENDSGCLSTVMNVIWLIFGGFWASICHLFFGLLLSVTIIGLPWGKQHFKMAKLALMPFGKNVEIDI